MISFKCVFLNNVVLKMGPNKKYMFDDIYYEELYGKAKEKYQIIYYPNGLLMYSPHQSCTQIYQSSTCGIKRILTKSVIDEFQDIYHHNIVLKHF